MSIDYKIIKIEKVLDKSNVLQHIYAQAVFTDGTLTLAYDTKVAANLIDDLSNQIEQWLKTAKVAFDNESENKPIDPKKDLKFVAVSERTLTIDKEKVLTATVDTIEAIASEDIIP